MKPVVTIDTQRDITSIILNEATKHGFDPIGFVAGAIGESNIREHAARVAAWPDVSFGLWQPAVAFLGDEVPGLSRDGNGAVLDTPANRATAREFCFDAERLAAYTAPTYAHLLAKNGGNSVAAWCRYNAPGLTPEQNPNFAHIKASHQEAEKFRDGADGGATTMKTVKKPNIKFVGCLDENFDTGRGGIGPEAVVLHIAEGSLGSIDNTFNSHNPLGPASTHFAVGKDGTIHQYVSTDDTAFGQGFVEEGFTAELINDDAGINPNKWTVSIEHEGSAEDDPEPTDEQFDASTRLSAWLFQEVLFTSVATDVDVDRKHVLGHRDISPESRTDDPPWTEAVFAKYIKTVRDLLGLP